MIQVVSHDIIKLQRMHRKWPHLLKKTFPPMCKEEMRKTWLKDLKGLKKAKKWPRNFMWTGAKRGVDTFKMKAKTLYNQEEAGVQYFPENPGTHSMWEYGSRYREWRGRFPASPVYQQAWRMFQLSGKNDISESFVKISLREMDKDIKKHGLK